MSNAVIFNGDYLKALKPKLKLNEAAYIETGSADPSTLSLSSPIGSIYLRSNGTLYVKYDAADSAWAPALTTGIGGSITSTSLEDSSVYFYDETDSTKKLYFQLSGISPNTSRTLSIPDLNGTLALGTSAVGYVSYWSNENTLTGEAQLSSSRGGTGVNNTGTLTYGSNNIIFSTSGATSLSLPTTGTLATLTGTENLSNKTINSSSIGSTTASSGAFTYLTVKGTGSAGTTYIDLLDESSAPTSPNAGYTRLYTTADVLNLKSSANEVFALDYSALTSSRTLTVPNRSSTIVTLDGNQTFTGILALSTANVVSLAITGGLKIGNITSSAVVAGSGAIRYSSGFLYYSDGTNWNTVAQYANSIYTNTSFTAVSNVNYFVDTSSAPITATLPSGSVNARIRFADVKEKWGLNNLTIQPAAGEKIDNLLVDESLIMDINGSWIELSWDTTSSSWVVTGSLSYGSSPFGFVTHTGNTLGTDLVIGTNDNYSLLLETNGSTRVKIDATGRVIIGNTDSILVGSSSNPRPLQIVGTSYQTTGISSVAFGNAYPSLILGRSKGTTIGDYTALINNDINGEIVFAGSDGNNLSRQSAAIRACIDGTVVENSVPGKIMFYTTSVGGEIPIERMAIDASGNVGIGTGLTPLERLHVAGNGLFTGDAPYLKISGTNNSAAVTTRIELNSITDYRGRGTVYTNNQDNEQWFSGVPYTGGGFSIGFDASTFQSFYKNKSILFINSDGNVGIGTTSPQTSLDINGGFKAAYDSYAVNANLTKYNHFVVATAAVMLNLPSLTSNDVGFTLYIKRVTAAGIVTINPGAGKTIDGSATWPLTSNYESVKLVWRGSSDWSIF